MACLAKNGEDIKEVVRLVLKPIWNAYHFFCLYANSDGIKAEEDFTSENLMDRYILAKLKNTVNAAVSKEFIETAQVIDYQEAKLDNQISALLLDVDRLDHLKQLDASGQFIDNLILDFMRDTEDRMVALNTYVKAHDVVKIKTSGHTMAGSAGNVGAYALANQCEKLSNITPADHIKHVEVLAGGAQDIYTRTKLFLWDYLNQQSTIKQIPKS